MASSELSSVVSLNGSHESFHSTQSSHNPPAESQLVSNPQISLPQSGGLQLQDVEEFLSNPDMQALLATSTQSNKQNPSGGKHRAFSGTDSSTTEANQVGAPKTSHHVSLLYLQSQQRGLNPEFEIGGDQNGFGGSVTINGQTFSSDEHWHSKKEAKEGLSQKALPFVQAMEHRDKLAPQENWIGKLLEYHNATTPMQGPVYTEYLLPGTLFACTCLIPSHPTPFGSKDDAFSSKKAARVNAAREAMQHIIAQGLANPDGSLIKSKNKVKTGPAVKVSENGLRVQKSATYAQRVNDLSVQLGLGAPFYQLRSQPAAPNIFSGAAHFSSTPIFPKPLGEVRNVFGKKNAKEECARAVWETLKDLAKKRGVNVQEVSEGDEDITMGM